MIAQEPPENLAEFAHKYFVDELGLQPEQISEASRNLVGAFDVLLRIQNRIDKENKL